MPCFYNDYVKGLDTYTDLRWNTSDVGRFDYKQTKKTIDKTLQGSVYGSAVEIGPGDGVWTRQILQYVSSLHLVEQSDEMLKRAEKNLGDVKNIAFERSDFMESNPPQNNDLVIAVRCLEYFDDKSEALKKMNGLLKSGGKLVVITKNSDLYTTKKVQDRTVHSGQFSREQMLDVIEGAGFKIEKVYPAVMRWKIKYKVIKGLFNMLHSLALGTGGLFYIPLLFRYSTESYAYVAIKK